MAEYVDIDPELKQEDVTLDEMKAAARLPYHVVETDKPMFGRDPGHYVILGMNIEGTKPKTYASKHYEGFFTHSIVYVYTGGRAIKVYPGKSAILIVRITQARHHVSITPYRGG